MNIRKRLKASAELQLSELVEKTERYCIEICKDLPIDPKELCRLVCSKSSKVLINQLTSRMAEQAEKQMVADYEAKQPNYEENY